MKIGDKIRIKPKGIIDYTNIQGFIMQILDNRDIQVRIACGLDIASCMFHPN
jgi:hypothetical protein